MNPGFADEAKAFLNSINPKYDWGAEVASLQLISELREGKAIQTRAFLRPIFKWLDKASQKQEGFQKAIHFAEWMILLVHEGDSVLEIPPQPHLQPNYAYNTIVTAAQKASLAPQAKQAYERMLLHGFCPDVFTVTSLIDVLGRCNQIDEAISVFQRMQAGPVKPNIVTCVTIIRCIALSERDSYFSQVLCVLEEAEGAATRAANGGQATLDPIIYNAALTACFVCNDIDPIRIVLRRMIAFQSLKNEYTLSLLAQLFLKIFEQMSQGQGYQGKEIEEESLRSFLLNGPISDFVEAGLLLQEEANNIRQLIADSGGNRKKLEKALNHYAYYILGEASSDELRSEVVEHDLEKLSERIVSGQDTHRNDFETLIHQCRKRKWPTETRSILTYMERICNEGIKVSQSYIPPQPHLAPNIDTYHAVLESFVAMGCAKEAWQTLEEMQSKGLVPTVDTFKIIIVGAIKFRSLDMASNCFWQMISQGLEPTKKLAQYMMRGFGADTDNGIKILQALWKSSLCADNSGFEKSLINLLLESCSVIGNLKSSIIVLDFLKSQNQVDPSFLLSDGDSLTALLLCCVSLPTPEQSISQMESWQKEGFLCNEPFVESVLKEAESSCIGDFRNKRVERNTYPVRGFGFSGILRHISSRRLFLRLALGILVKSGISYVHAKLFPPDEIKDPVMEVYCSVNDEATPYLLGQHVSSRMGQIRSKAEKNLLQVHILQALQQSDESWRLNFIVNTLAKLPVSCAHAKTSGKTASSILREFRKLIVGTSFEDNLVQLLKTHTLDFEVFKELVKELDVKNSTHDILRKTLAQKFTQFLNDDEESPTKIVQVLGTCNLESFVSQPRMIESLVNFLLENEDAAIVVYVGKDTVKQKMFVQELIERGQHQLAVRYIIRYKLAGNEEYAQFLTESPDINVSSRWGHLKGPCMALPLPSERVIVVNSNATLLTAKQVLLHPSLREVGIDVEWKPFRKGFQKTKCSLLQIATQTHAFLFDLMLLEDTWQDDVELEDDDINRYDFSEIIKSLFSSAQVLKLGYGLEGDVQRLQWSFPEQKGYTNLNNFLDLAEIQESLFQDERRGLSMLAHKVLGESINKQMQMSNWEQRPLTSEQITYAALDAFCLLPIYFKLQEIKSL